MSKKVFVIITLITSVVLVFIVQRQYMENQKWWDWDEYTGLEVYDKVIVMGRMTRENTDWVAQHLPDWGHAIYTVDDITAPLHTPMNKGKESLAYLTYIIEHYDALPQIMVFIHSHRYSPKPIQHNDAFHYDSLRSIKSLQLPHVLNSGYVNLRCVWKSGCNPSQTRHNPHVTPEYWAQIFGNETAFPEQIGVTCCAQFAVTRENVLKRELAEYVHYRKWIMETELNDEKSGRVFEYLWHIIFGMDAVHCPQTDVCYCEAFGKC